MCSEQILSSSLQIILAKHAAFGRGGVEAKEDEEGWIFEYLVACWRPPMRSRRLPLRSGLERDIEVILTPAHSVRHGAWCLGFFRS